MAKNTEAAPLRVIVENVRPNADGGEFPVKRTAGESLEVLADMLVDGHEVLQAFLRSRGPAEDAWTETEMEPLGNDVFRASFEMRKLGTYEYCVEAWIDRFSGWAVEVRKKVDAGQEVSSELLEGATLIEEAAARADQATREWLVAQAKAVRGNGSMEERVRVGLDPVLLAVMKRYVDRRGVARSQPTLSVLVERERARYGAWYEMFPRSTGTDPKRGGTFKDAIERLPDIARMGFDVIYLPPIHPIGRTHRKGPNNSLKANPGDPGSPWAIGGPEGGHTAINPELGTMQDFESFLHVARGLGMEIALDLAFQCSPDHPWVKEHPQWFRHRPDGTIKYAENPPKKYQDIYPFDFECADWRNLYESLKQVVLFWVKKGVEIFRVDNPHTKPFRFWQWMIAEVRREHPRVIYLSEAFTRPKVMKYLAKAGFSQSYSYFTWRNTKHDIVEYFTELTRGESREYMRPNLFANTPDIFHEYLQHGGRAAFQIRAVLAGTLGASWGIYGPPFELCEARAVKGTEEYLDSEKYQVRVWDHDRPGNIREYIARINQARRENAALHYDHGLRFHPVDNDQMVFFSKISPDRTNVVWVVCSVDPHHAQEGTLTLPLSELGIGQHESFQVHDVLSDARLLWQGERRRIRLEPSSSPAVILVLRRRIATERDFDYYL